jgi:hypothetical protein
MTDTVSFFTKPGCALCDEAWPWVERLAKQHRASVERIDIEAAGGETYYSYRYRIPVVVWRGVELGWGRISQTDLAAEFARVNREAPR